MTLALTVITIILILSMLFNVFLFFMIAKERRGRQEIKMQLFKEIQRGKMLDGIIRTGSNLQKQTQMHNRPIPPGRGPDLHRETQKIIRPNHGGIIHRQ